MFGGGGGGVIRFSAHLWIALHCIAVHLHCAFLLLAKAFFVFVFRYRTAVFCGQ